jgi:lysylphosphatidylglycerol synthetase-like protein (DUF2156 family)
VAALAAERDIPDLLELRVPIGGRAVIMADLHLVADPTPGQLEATSQLASAVDAATGPGVLVVAGNLFDSGVEPGAALISHPRLVQAMAAFAGRPGRRLIVLPGDRDAKLAWSADSRSVLTAAMGAELALAVDLQIETGAGRRQVRVEPGHDLDALSRFADPRNPGESPIAQHMREELLPAVRRRQQGLTGRGTAWLAGMEQLDDPAAFSRFIASRLAYRRLGRSWWLLLAPIVAAVALRLPSLALRSARAGALSSRLGILVSFMLIELILLVLLSWAALRRTTRALAALSLAESGRDPNDTARAQARGLLTDGHTGFITAHTCRPELSHLGEGFYINAGCGAEVVTEVPTRLPGLGLPPIFLAHRQTAWVELDAGIDLHVRLFHSRRDVAGATLLERALVDRLVESGTGDLHPQVVATFPQGDTWPPPPAADAHHRRVRRVASVVVLAAGFLSVLSALADPVADRLNVVQQLFPIAIPETAAALAALGGIGLIVLARGIRRGQRRAWLVCLALLVTVAILHLIKGVDVEDAVVALAVAGYLWLHRESFKARTDVAQLRRGLLGVTLAAVLTVVAGTMAVKLGSWLTISYQPVRRHLSWPQALLASLERMVGITNVVLPHRLNEFFSPAMATVGIGLALALVVVLFRPVVRHRHSGAGQRTDGAATMGTEAGATDAGGGDTAAAMVRARKVVDRYGSGTLDYFALRPDKQFFFWADTLVAYAVYGGVCLVSPDPIGPRPEREDAWRAFRRYVDQHGWALGGLGIGEEWLSVYRATGMHDLYAGDEAVVRVANFTLEGGRFKGLRQAVNRIARHGYRISFHDPSRLDPGLRARLADVMTRSRQGDVERGFSMTLGRAFDPADAGLLLAVVHAPAGEHTPPGTLGLPVAFCQYVPAPGIAGYSLDLMRRDAGAHPNGLIDFAVVETIEELRRRGNEGLGLNFATMRAVLAGEAGEGLSQRVQAWMLRRMGDSMQIESLWKFNAKFDPDWQPRYAIYDAPENLLAVAIAVARAESFWELPVIGRFLTPSVPTPTSRASRAGRVSLRRRPGGRRLRAARWRRGRSRSSEQIRRRRW